MPSVNLTPAILQMNAVKTITATNIVGTRPVFCGQSWNAARGGDQRLGGRRPASLISMRGIGSQTDDVFTVRGIDMPEQTNDTLVQVFKQTGTLGAETNTDFQTTFTYAAIGSTAALTNNWIVVASIFKITQTGTAINTTAGSQTITGTGTKFTEELWIGDQVQVGNELFTVAAIASDTSLTAEVASGVTQTTGVMYQMNRVLGHATTYSPILAVQSAPDFSVSNVGGFTKVVLATATDLPSGAELRVYNATGSREILASGLHVNERATIQAADIMWAACTGGTANEFTETGLTIAAFGVI